jgi:predicted transporter
MSVQRKAEMSFQSILQQLELDVWYKVPLVIAAVALITSLFVPVQGISNTQLQLVSVGVLLASLGVWMNHKRQKEIRPLPGSEGTLALYDFTIRRPTFLGILFIVLGVILLAFGGLSIAGCLPLSFDSPEAGIVILLGHKSLP